MNVGGTVYHDANASRRGVVSHSASADLQWSPPRKGSIRILTYNILFGRRWSESLAVIRDADADVICLQELVPEGSSYEPAVPLDQIADDIGMPHDFAFLWGKNKKRIANMTLARDGVSDRRLLRAWPTPAYGLVNRVQVSDVQFTMANVHLSPMLGPPLLMFLPSEGLRLNEVGHLSRWASTCLGPVVAAGDFNTFSVAPAFRRMKRDWQNARDVAKSKIRPTRPTYGIPFVIDHVFVRGDAVLCDYDVMPGGGSDHKAVLATIKLPAKCAFASAQSPV